MQTQSIELRFKPIRIGWCVKQGDMAGLKAALELSHTLWGGKYNPVIPVGNTQLQARLVRRFHVDILYPISESDEVNEFVKLYPYLETPYELSRIFDGENPWHPNFLDIYHPVRQIHERFSGKEMSFTPSHLTWQDDDPLALALLASIGNYPQTPDQYFRFFAQLPGYEKVDLAKDAPLPPTLYQYFSPTELTTYRTEFSLDFKSGLAGFYVGDSGNFDDLSEFWNLRAAGKDLWFYDPAHAERLNAFKENLILYLKEHTYPRLLWTNEYSPKIAIHSRSDQIKLDEFGERTVLHHVDPHNWNGLNTKPPIVYLKDSSLIGHSVIGMLEKEANTLTIPLQNKPFYMDDIHVSGQHLTYSVSNDLPRIAELNDYYGFNYHFNRFHTRVQKDGMGIFDRTNSNSLTLHPLPPSDVISELFKVFGIKASLSEPGLRAKRLIAQMGGLQDCRVFKIAGTRNLLTEMRLGSYVTRSESIQTINGMKGVGDQASQHAKRKEFQDKYGHLYIEVREQHNSKLTDHNVFDYMLKKKVFQAGLEIKCPNCLLVFWLSIDDVKTHVNCSYCDHQFNITPMLKDRDWRFRRSGLFSMDDQGSVPVALLLQQMDSSFHGLYYATAMNLEPMHTDINKCETDFVILTSGRTYESAGQQIVIGECKTRGMIEEQDINNLAKVRDALSHEELDVFILFSKLSAFTDAEIQLCKSLQPEHERRVIMLTDQELEPYRLYAWTPEDAVMKKYVVTLEDMAWNTHVMYLHDRANTGSHSTATK